MNNLIKGLSIVCASLILSACQGSDQKQSTIENNSTNKSTVDVKTTKTIKLRSITPTNNSAGILTNEDIILDFSINITPSIFENNSFVLIQDENIIQTDKKIVGNKLILSPKVALKTNSQYTVKIKSIEENNLTISDLNRHISFRTIEGKDITSPTLISTSIS